jgi:hypothetical protein
VRETSIFSEHYDFSLSLLLLEDEGPRYSEEFEPVTYDRFVPPERRREW